MITTVTMNASIDKAYYIAGTITPGTVMRVEHCLNSAGGKGLNVARVAALCGSKAKATGIVGGHNGDYILELLNQDGIAHDFFRVRGETRSCINILAEDKSSTEFLEPGFEVSAKDQAAFLDFFGTVIYDGSMVTISGSVPKGIPADIYARLIHIARESGKTVLLDSSGNYLKEALKAKPDFVKPNRSELEDLFGIPIRSLKEAVAGGKKLQAMGIRHVVISLGSDGAMLICEDGCFHARPPKLDAINTVGCGDSMVAAFAAALEQGKAAGECLSYAVAVSAANALSMRTGYFEQEHLKRILPQVTVSAL